MSIEDESGIEPDAVDAGDVESTEGVTQTDDVTDLATSLGWKPEEKWKGDKSTWTDAKTFLKQQVTKAKTGKETVERTVRATKDMLEKAKTGLIKDYEARLKQARADNDTEAALEAQQAIQDARSGTDLQVKQATFIARNPWFEADDDANAIAVAAAGRAANKGASIDEQFEAAEKAVKKAMPELFDDDLDTHPSKPTPKAPVLAGGQRTAAGTSQRVQGWGDMPANVRMEMEKNFVKTGDLTREECAKSYWKNQ